MCPCGAHLAHGRRGERHGTGPCRCGHEEVQGNGVGCASRSRSKPLAWAQRTHAPARSPRQRPRGPTRPCRALTVAKSSPPGCCASRRRWRLRRRGAPPPWCCSWPLRPCRCPAGAVAARISAWLQLLRQGEIAIAAPPCAARERCWHAGGVSPRGVVAAAGLARRSGAAARSWRRRCVCVGREERGWRWQESGAMDLPCCLYDRSLASWQHPFKPEHSSPRSARGAHRTVVVREGCPLQASLCCWRMAHR